MLYEKPSQSTGTVTYLQGFLKALDTISCGRHKFFLFANPESYEFCKYHAPNYKTIIFPFSGKTRAIRTLMQFLLVPLYSRIYSLDVINFLGTTGSFCTGCASVQHVKTLHHYLYPDSLDRRKVQYLKLMLKPSIQCADLVIANSTFTKKGIIGRINKRSDRIVTINEAVDHSVFYPQKEKENCFEKLKKYGVTKPYILFVSTLWRYKNIEALIEALYYSNIEHDIVVLGDTTNIEYQKQIKQLVETRGIQTRVKMIGHIKNRSVVRDFYIGADLYVSPSLAETFGLTILESMACGTPVIGSKLTSIPEVAGNAAILFDPHNYKDIANCMEQVLTDPILKKKLVKLGYERAQKYTWEKTAKATLKAYELSILYHNLRKHIR